MVSIVPTMATYETVLTIPQKVEATFAFVSDFRNAARWDPRTYAVEKATDGPIGVGTRFMLTGGMLREDWVERLRIPKSMAGMALPYDIVEFDSPNEFVLEGESRLVRYRDHLEFSADGSNTRLRYFAELELKGLLAVGEPLLKMMFKRIGDDATRDLPATVARGT
jgi:dehydrogenase/reductase SDR family protein 12